MRLAVFEGPLDLLLHLIEKQEVDIWEVSIAEIARQYLAFLRDIPRIELEAAGEYLAMAALLVRIKARHLLPHAVIDEDDEDEADAAALEEELRQRLAEYKRYKDVAEALAELSAARAQYGLRPLPLTNDGPVVAPGPPADFHVDKLTRAFLDLLTKERPEPRKPPQLRKVDLRGAMVQVRRALRAARGSVSFRSLFSEHASRWDWIVTFLAVLELVHMGNVQVHQPELFGELHLKLAA